MEPTFTSHDIVFVERWSDTFALNDVVILSPPTKQGQGLQAQSNLIKRIVAGPNSNIYIDDYKLFVNDTLIKENLAYSVIWKHRSFSCRYSDEYTTSSNEYFVLGDNRCEALDSRYFGGLKRKNILGKVIYKISL